MSHHQSWARDIVINDKCTVLLRLLWQVKLREMLDPLSQNVVSATYLAAMQHAKMLGDVVATVFTSAQLYCNLQQLI